MFIEYRKPTIYKGVSFWKAKSMYSQDTVGSMASGIAKGFPPPHRYLPPFYALFNIFFCFAKHLKLNVHWLNACMLRAYCTHLSAEYLWRTSPQENHPPRHLHFLLGSWWETCTENATSFQCFENVGFEPRALNPFLVNWVPVCKSVPLYFCDFSLRTVVQLGEWDRKSESFRSSRESLARKWWQDQRQGIKVFDKGSHSSWPFLSLKRDSAFHISLNYAQAWFWTNII